MFCALRCRVAVSLLILLPTASGTTLVLFYDPVNGAILATDSSLVDGRDAARVRGQIKSGTPVKAMRGCKIHTCGRYLVASTGVWGRLRGRDLTLVCQTAALTNQSIDAFRQAFEVQYVSFANDYVSWLASRKQAPKINEHMFSLAIAGFESNRPVLRYRVLRYTGTVGGKNSFDIAETLSCPGDDECREVRKVAGIFDAIERARQQGNYKQPTDPFQFATQLVQIEITANLKTKYVLSPISVVQINGPIPKWFQSGLCNTSKSGGLK